MIDARIAELRDSLSAVLRRVAAGERVRVLRRNEVVAEIVPPGTVAPEERSDDSLDCVLKQLEREGIVRRGSGRWPEWLDQPATGAGASAVDALLAEREDGR